MTPTLNWREIALLVDRIRPELESVFVDRIVVPDRPYFPGGYIKGEWALRLTSRRAERTFLFSIRPRHPYFALHEKKTFRASPGGTHSPFDLALSKHLKGTRLQALEALPRERVVILWFSDPARASGTSPRSVETELGLVLVLIPAAPEALLVRRTGGDPGPWPILTRSRTGRTEPSWTPPDGSQAPAEPPIRQELIASSRTYSETIEREIRAEAFALRVQAAEREIRDRTKQATSRARQSETAAKEARSEPDWLRYGDLLKASLANPPSIENGTRRVRDYETGAEVTIPSDPKLSAQAQVEKFYSLARRRTRRLKEAENRQRDFAETASRLQAQLEKKPSPGDWKALEAYERAAGLSLRGAGQAGERGPGAKPGKAWLGRTFHSRDGLAILVGRSRDENLELTFKHARGNDLWLHVRGRPGAHAVIPLQPGKSAPLETLLDAANLVLYYSGGEKWGKTEVDYTFKKYVRRIKDSTEASYVNNKTLIIEPDPSRIKRLLEMQS